MVAMSVVRHHLVEAAHLFRVSKRLDLKVLSAFEREAEDRLWLPSRSPRRCREPVKECELRERARPEKVWGRAAAPAPAWVRQNRRRHYRNGLRLSGQAAP
jgi:hypothetical protein